MRRFTTLLGATAFVALAAACANNTHPVTGAAAPVGVATTSGTPTATPSAATPSAAAPSATVTTPATRAPSSAPPTTRSATPSPATTDLAHLTIDPDHIGPLKIGMSLAAAKATGLITLRTSNNDGDCVSAYWKGRTEDQWMIFNGRYGLRALSSWGAQQTPEGINPGDSLAAVRKAYPAHTWRVDGFDIADSKRTDGDFLVDAVKGDGAHYRIDIQQSKVVTVELESDEPGCYE